MAGELFISPAALSFFLVTYHFEKNGADSCLCFSFLVIVMVLCAVGGI